MYSEFLQKLSRLELLNIITYKLSFAVVCFKSLSLLSKVMWLFQPLLVEAELKRELFNLNITSQNIKPSDICKQMLQKYFLEINQGLKEVEIPKVFSFSQKLPKEWTVLKRTMFFSECEERFNNLKNLLWNEKDPWMVKILCETIDTNKVKITSSSVALIVIYVSEKGLNGSK